MRPNVQDIAVPPFPPATRWIGEEPPDVERICARGPLLVHFIDFAQLNSVRALPYVRAWHERYEPHGLMVLGVNSPRFAFTADETELAAGLTRLEIRHPVAADPAYEIWHGYGCRGWPSLFLWGRGGVLRWFHFGEGEYEATEQAIREELDDGNDLPAPLDPLRPADAAGAMVAPPSEEVFPGGAIEAPWSGEESEAPLEMGYEGGGAYATVDGEGALEVALDGRAPREIGVTAPGLYELAEHSRHERHRLALRPSAGVRVWSVSFAPALP